LATDDKIPREDDPTRGLGNADLTLNPTALTCSVGSGVGA